MAVKVSKLTGLLLSTFIVTNVINDVANGVNVTDRAILGTLVAVGRYILMAVVIIYAVNQID